MGDTITMNHVMDVTFSYVIIPYKLVFYSQNGKYFGTLILVSKWETWHVEISYSFYAHRYNFPFAI